MYNILEGREEQDRVVYQDAHPETGFVLLPDFKWDQKDLQNLYLLAICRRRDVLSLRELGREHLPLLKNILVKGEVGECVHFILCILQSFTYVCAECKAWEYRILRIHNIIIQPF